MTKGNDSREFFEIFKTTPKEDNVHKKVVIPQTEPAYVNPQSPLSQDKQTARPTATTTPLEWIKNTRTEDTISKEKSETFIPSHPLNTLPKSERVTRKDEVTIRQETLIIGAIAATFLSIACFFVGHKVGYNKGVMNQSEEWLETIEPQESKKTVGPGLTGSSDVSQKTSNKAVPFPAEGQADKLKPIIKDKWTLRVVSYKNTKDNLERAKETACKIQEMLGYDTFIVNNGKELFICVGEFADMDSADLVKTQKSIAEFKYENKKQFEGCYPVRMK